MEWSTFRLYHDTLVGYESTPNKYGQEFQILPVNGRADRWEVREYNSFTDWWDFTGETFDSVERAKKWCGS